MAREALGDDFDLYHSRSLTPDTFDDESFVFLPATDFIASAEIITDDTDASASAGNLFSVYKTEATSEFRKALDVTSAKITVLGKRLDEYLALFKPIEVIDEDLQKAFKQFSQTTFSEIRKEIERLRKEFDAISKFCKEFDSEVRKDSVYREQYRCIDEETPVVTRFGLISEKFKHIVNTNSTSSNILHPAEFYVLSEAIKYLQTRPSSIDESVRGFGDYEYKNNLVICDIFKRESGKITKEDSSDKPELHTLVLWRISENDIVIIDPSNYTFSSFISGKGIIPDINISAEYNSAEKEYKELKKGFYVKHGADEGRTLESARDCIDVAIKIALEINEMQKKGIEVEAIKKLLIEKMSNSSGQKHDDIKLLRDAHSSSASVRDKFYEFFKSFSHALERNPQVHEKLINLFGIKKIKKP